MVYWSLKMHENKKHIGRKKHASIDGIISDGRRLGLPLERDKSQKDQKSSLADVSKRAEGFHPMRSGNHGLGELETADIVGLNLDEPIKLDDVAKKKKRFNLLFKRQKDHKKLTRRALMKRFAFGFLGLILISGIYFGVKFYQTERNVFRGGGKAPGLASKVDISQLKGEGDGRVNILLLGIGGPGHDGEDLTDTIMIASVDPVNNKIDLLSIPRDLWVSIPGNGNQKINAAYAYGKQQSKAKTLAGQEQDGLALIDKAIAPVIGININYHAVVDFKAFKDTVDAVGGVTFNVPETLYDPTIAWENNWNPTIAKAGVQTMHGAQALLYARSRETSSDFARGERQRQLLVALKEKILSLGTFSNPVKISNLLNSLGNNVYTDFSLNDMSRLYQITSKIPSGSITSLDLVTPPHNLLTTAAVNGLSTVQPLAGVFDYSAIKTYIRSTLKDGYIAKENATIAVYNATNVTGLATTTGSLLKSYGYNVTTIDSTKTATNPSVTTIVDFSKGKQKYTKNYLENRFGVKAVQTLPTTVDVTPPINTDFVIILGQDVAASG